MQNATAATTTARQHIERAAHRRRDDDRSQPMFEQHRRIEHLVLHSIAYTYTYNFVCVRDAYKFESFRDTDIDTERNRAP